MAQDDNLWYLIKKHVPGPHWQRIETSMTSAGVPDLNGCTGGSEVWVELKSVRAGLKIKSFTPLQAGWLLKRAGKGGRTWLCVRHRPADGRLGLSKLDRIVLYPGTFSPALREHGIRVVPWLHFKPNHSNGWAEWGDVVFNKPFPYEAKAHVDKEWIDSNNS
jgi:hypothetical protein